MEAARSAPQGAHYYAKLLPEMEMKKEGKKFMGYTSSFPSQHSLYPGGKHTLAFLTNFWPLRNGWDETAGGLPTNWKVYSAPLCYSRSTLGYLTLNVAF